MLENSDFDGDTSLISKINCLFHEEGTISQNQISKVYKFDEETNKVFTFLFEPELKIQKFF